MGALTESDYAELARSWITPELASQARLTRVISIEGSQIAGRNGAGNYAGVVFPYYWPGEHQTRGARLRRDVPDTDPRGRTKNKYMAPPRSGNLFYFIPGTDPALLQDKILPITITEGEKKALALWRYAHLNSVPLFLPIGLAGVWSWRGVIGKEVGPDGKRRDQRGPIPDFSRIAWEGRTVYILFDSNITQEDVAIARLALAKELRSRGARVMLIDLPAESEVNGVDDYLGKHGSDPLKDLFRQAREFIPKEGLAQFKSTDLGNDAAFESLYSGQFLFCRSRGKWLAWNDHAWQIDELGCYDRAMIEVAQQRLHACASIEDPQERKGAVKSAISLQNMGKRKAALESATSNPTFRRTINMFDQDPWLLATLNGVIELQTGEFRQGRRSDMITMQCPVEYDPESECPRWLNFLEDIFEPHAELIPFVKRAIGYSLTGNTREECLFILHGIGRNGKGTLLRTIQNILGNYAQTADFSTFTADKEKKGDIRNDIARMKGARFIATSEASEGIRLAEATVKNLTGGDIITARFLHAENFDFLPTHKIWISVNHLPTIRATDKGIWSRIRLLPFDVSFSGREDMNLKADLMAELPGILSWAVQGCLEWQEVGLSEPEAVKRATQEYRADSDQIGRFLEECCFYIGHSKQENQPSLPTVKARARNLYHRYRKWAEDVGEFVIKEKQFGQNLIEKGLSRVHTKHGSAYQGVELVESGGGDPGPAEG